MTLTNNPTPNQVGDGSYYFDSAGGYQQSNIGYADAISLASVATTGALQNATIYANHPVTNLNNPNATLDIQSLTSVSTTSQLTMANINAGNPITGFATSGFSAINEQVPSTTPTAIIALAEIKANNPVTGFGGSGIDPKIIKYEMTIRI